MSCHVEKALYKGAKNRSEIQEQVVFNLCNSFEEHAAKIENSKQVTGTVKKNYGLRIFLAFTLINMYAADRLRSYFFFM